MKIETHIGENAYGVVKPVPSEEAWDYLDTQGYIREGVITAFWTDGTTITYTIEGCPIDFDFDSEDVFFNKEEAEKYLQQFPTYDY